MTALHADNLACSEVISARSIYVEKISTDHSLGSLIDEQQVNCSN